MIGIKSLDEDEHIQILHLKRRTSTLSFHGMDGLNGLTLGLTPIILKGFHQLFLRLLSSAQTILLSGVMSSKVTQELATFWQRWQLSQNSQI